MTSTNFSTGSSPTLKATQDGSTSLSFGRSIFQRVVHTRVFLPSSLAGKRFTAELCVSNRPIDSDMSENPGISYLGLYRLNPGTTTTFHSTFLGNEWNGAIKLKFPHEKPSHYIIIPIPSQNSEKASIAEPHRLRICVRESKKAASRTLHNGIRATVERAFSFSVTKTIRQAKTLSENMATRDLTCMIPHGIFDETSQPYFQINSSVKETILGGSVNSKHIFYSPLSRQLTGLGGEKKFNIPARDTISEVVFNFSDREPLIFPIPPSNFENNGEINNISFTLHKAPTDTSLSSTEEISRTYQVNCQPGQQQAALPILTYHLDKVTPDPLTRPLFEVEQTPCYRDSPNKDIYSLSLRNFLEEESEDQPKSDSSDL
jgi:hypothetical protein